MPNDPKILLETGTLTRADRMHKGKEIGTAMNADPDPAVASAGAQLLSTSNSLETTNQNRNALQDDVDELTKNLEALDVTWEERYTTAAKEAERIYPKQDGIWTGYGFAAADVEQTERAAPPKVTGLQLTQGDAAGEIELIWDPQERKTIDGYHPQINITEPIDPKEWRSGKPISVTASKATIVQLTTGQKYWVRVSAYVGAVDGAPSDPKAIIAP